MFKAFFILHFLIAVENLLHEIKDRSNIRKTNKQLRPQVRKSLSVKRASFRRLPETTLLEERSDTPSEKSQHSSSNQDNVPPSTELPQRRKTRIETADKPPRKSLMQSGKRFSSVLFGSMNSSGYNPTFEEKTLESLFEQEKEAEEQDAKRMLCGNNYRLCGIKVRF